MDKDLKRKWVKALRSGKYKQGKETLNDGHGHYCCLGVMLRVAGLSARQISQRHYPLDISEARALLPHSICARLASMNDGVMKWSGNPQTFRQIAKYIEENL
jgi:hypothetical protein